MPKISDERRAARRTEILYAAWRCFDRAGVAATTMEDIRIEAGGSAGALYLYFPSKDAVIRGAIASSVTDYEALVETIASSPDAATFEQFLGALLRATQHFGIRTDGINLFRLAIQGWAHAQADPDTAALIRTSYLRLRRRFAQIATGWDGPRAQPRDIAELIASITIGFVTQCALGLDPEPSRHVRAVVSAHDT